MRGFIHDPYKVLGIAQDATQREVRQAYRRLAMKFNPDRNPGKPEAAKRLKQVQVAYESLTGLREPGRISPTASYKNAVCVAVFRKRASVLQLLLGPKKAF